MPGCSPSIASISDVCSLTQTCIISKDTLIIRMYTTDAKSDCMIVGVTELG